MKNMYVYGIITYLMFRQKNSIVLLLEHLMFNLQLYAYSYCIYKIQPKANQPNSIVVTAVLTVPTMEIFFQFVQ